MKKTCIMLLMAIFVFFLPTAVYADENGQTAADDVLISEHIVVALPMLSLVFVDGESVNFNAYNIEGNNYFKLRDLAYVLDSTNKQFAVDWDAAAAIISLTANQPYTLVGGEMSEPDMIIKQARPSDTYISVNGGSPLLLTAYNIDDYNYFKLIDVGQALDFGVIWDETARAVYIETAYPYNIIAESFTEPSLEEEFAREVANIVNEERRKRGLAPLEVDSKLCAAAQTRAEELVISYSHRRPDGSSFPALLHEYGIQFNGCGENIASGQISPQAVMYEWMHSRVHHDIILVGYYTKIGVGVVKRPAPQTGYFWAQIFI